MLTESAATAVTVPLAVFVAACAALAGEDHARIDARSTKAITTGIRFISSSS